MAKNELNRPYISSRHLRYQSPQVSYFSAIFQYFCMKLSESLKNRKQTYCWKRIFDLGLQKNLAAKFRSLGDLVHFLTTESTVK